MKNLLIILTIFCVSGAYAQGQLQNEASGNITYASGHVMQLAEAFPADKYSWVPMEGVRSTAGVFAHIISANYFFASKLGATIPEGVNMQTLEQDLTEKEDIQAELKQSYDVLLGAIMETKDDALAETVEYPFPGEFTNMSSILIALSHTNEHLGQLIAYARMNGITPPWSMAMEEGEGD